MLTGKKYLQNLRALRMITGDLLRPLLKDGKITWHSQLINVLEEKSNSSRTTKLWVDVHIKPLFLCLLFIRTELQEDWPLLKNAKSMILLFFAANHVNYANQGLYYLCSMEAFSDHAYSHFMKGEHTIQLSAIPWLGMWSDMGIKVSYNQISKGVDGVTRQSRNMEKVKV